MFLAHRKNLRRNVLLSPIVSWYGFGNNLKGTKWLAWGREGGWLSWIKFVVTGAAYDWLFH